MSKEKIYQYWQLKRDEQQVLWVEINTPNSPQNTLNTEAMNELDDIIESVMLQTNLRAMVFHSTKPGTFLAGADVHYFSQLPTIDAVLEFVRQGQRILDKLAHLKLQTIALISGVCLGGGLELALACHHRIAEDNEKTRLGLPEIKLGIAPVWGGIRRLVELTGAPQGLGLMMQGKLVNARAAAKLGFIDEAVPKRQLEAAVRSYIERKPAKRTANYTQALTNMRFIRPLLGKYIRKQLKQKVREEHYPAPFRVLDLWEKYGPHSKRGAEAEVEVIRELVDEHPTAKNLIRVFKLQEQLKNLGKQVEFNAQHVHVIGAGTMGGDIAAWCALNGLKVTLQDRTAASLTAAFQRAHELFKRKLKNDRLVKAALDRLIPDVKGEGVAKADVIIEAIFENLKAKQELFNYIEQYAKPDAVLATNTSSILLEDIAHNLNKPGRLVGIHFFNPVPLMQLVEVVQGKRTETQWLDKATAFVRQIDRLPLPVKSSPGFLVNRLLMPYLMESVKLLEEGVPAYLIDKTAEDFGMPMGPIELSDTVGLDICLAVAKNLSEKLGGTIPQRLEALVQQGHLGRKTKKGFYEYRKGKAVKEQPTVPAAGETDIMHRLILRMLNEASACLREKIIESADLLDGGMIFGTGFAPFRGGLIHYANSLGEQELTILFNTLEQQYGDRFKADSGWSTLLMGI